MGLDINVFKILDNFDEYEDQDYEGYDIYIEINENNIIKHNTIFPLGHCKSSA